MPSWTLCVLEAESLAPELSTLLNPWSDLSFILSYMRASFSVLLTVLGLHGHMVPMKQTNT